MSGGFSLAAPGMGLPGWGCRPRRVPSRRQQWPRCAQQEQGHLLQGPSPLAPCAAPQRGLPLSRPLGHRMGALREAALVTGPGGGSAQGSSTTKHFDFRPQIQPSASPSIPSHHLGTSGAFLVIFRRKQTQSHPAATEIHLAVVTPFFRSQSLPRGLQEEGRGEEPGFKVPCRHHFLGGVKSSCCAPDVLCWQCWLRPSHHPRLHPTFAVAEGPLPSGQPCPGKMSRMALTLPWGPLGQGRLRHPGTAPPTLFPLLFPLLLWSWEKISLATEEADV